MNHDLDSIGSLGKSEFQIFKDEWRARNSPLNIIYFRSRTSTELQRRCSTLLTVIEREINGTEPEKSQKRGAGDKKKTESGAKKAKKEAA